MFCIKFELISNGITVGRRRLVLRFVLAVVPTTARKPVILPQAAMLAVVLQKPFDQSSQILRFLSCDFGNVEPFSGLCYCLFYFFDVLHKGKGFFGSLFDRGYAVDSPKKKVDNAGLHPDEE